MLLPYKSRHLLRKKSVFFARTGRSVIHFIINWLPFTGCQCFGREKAWNPRHAFCIYEWPYCSSLYCGFNIGLAGGGVRIRIVNIFNHLKRTRVSCPQNFNASEQVLSKIVEVSYDSQCFGKFDFTVDFR